MVDPRHAHQVIIQMNLNLNHLGCVPFPQSSFNMGSLVLLEANLICYDIARIIDDYAFYVDLYTFKMWYVGNRLHRDFDQPAEVSDDGHKCWYQHGKRHRDNDRPAVIWSDGTRMWCVHGENHRDNDKPAVIRANGSRAWYQRGILHRANGLPTEVTLRGTKERGRGGSCIRNARGITFNALTPRKRRRSYEYT
jgi:hypothetical protein